MDFGFSIILGLGVIMFLILFMLVNANPNTIVYDEMQKSIQGDAYKYSGITCTFIGIIFAYLLDFKWFPMDGSFAMLTVSILSVLIYVVYMIIKGAYFGVSGKWKVWTLMEFFVGISNTVSGVFRILQNGLTYGKLTMDNANLLIGISFIITAVTVLIRKAMEKKDEEQ